MNDKQPGPSPGYGYQHGPPGDYGYPQGAPPGYGYPQYPQPPGQVPKPRKPRRALRAVSYVALGGACLGIGIVIGVGASHANPSTRTVPGPGRTVTVPGPARTVTVTPSPPPAGTTIGTWSGTGNENTPSFNAPASGDYVVSWTYSGNNDPSVGGATNFSISATDSGADTLGLPNDIASSGSGSTEVTGASGVESFNVQAAGGWMIQVVSAP